MAKTPGEVKQPIESTASATLHAVETGRLRRVEPHGHMGEFLIVAPGDHVAIGIEPGDRGAIAMPQPQMPQLGPSGKPGIDGCKEALAALPRPR
jgi:hypothetical protein